MNGIFNTGKKRTGFIAVLLLFCAVCGVRAAAQTASDKPLNAASLAALIAELKGVVARTEQDEKNSALVAQKWDARKDLAGKTKAQVISLLYEDAKSVIADSGMRYQIYSMFAAYKRMPDEMFSNQKPTDAPAKSEAVAELIDLTFEAHPYIGIEEQLAKLPGTKDVEKAKAHDKKNRFQVFDDALAVNNRLTPAQKAFVKANYEKLTENVDKMIDRAIKQNFTTNRWVDEGLRQSYEVKFTAQELDDLIKFFQSTAGRQVLSYIRQKSMAELITGNGGKLDFTDADLAEHDKFIATALGAKFIAAYLTETIEYEELKEGEVRRNIPNADGFAILERANLNEFFNRFVAENYKK